MNLFSDKPGSQFGDQADDDIFGTTYIPFKGADPCAKGTGEPSFPQDGLSADEHEARLFSFQGQDMIHTSDDPSTREGNF